VSLASAPTSPSGPGTENLAGLVERVTFHNEESGFCVLRLKAGGQRDSLTVIGHADMISASEPSGEGARAGSASCGTHSDSPRFLVENSTFCC